MIFSVAVVLCLVLTARTGFAHDAPKIVPTRIDFEAARVPKNCNDQPTFKSILTNWVAREALATDVDRRLVVRIQRLRHWASPAQRTGGEQDKHRVQSAQPSFFDGFCLVFQKKRPKLSFRNVPAEQSSPTAPTN